MVCVGFWIMGAGIAYSQGTYSADFHDQTLSSNSQYAARSSAFESAVYRYMSGLEGRQPVDTRAVLTIPVVVHLMHLPSDAVPNNNTSNLTDERVREAIRLLNHAFRNSGPYAGDPTLGNANIPSANVEIEFCLAQLDENGDATTGIVRYPTQLSDLYRDDDCPGGGGPQDLCLKSLSRWNTNDYLNIWVVNSLCTSLNGDCLVNAYSYLPGAHGSAVDGIVIEAEFFGSTPGKTTELIHEAGHYLGLFNTYYQPSIAPSLCANDNCLAFGDGICDTPPDSDRTPFDCESSEAQNTCSTDADDQSANNPFDSDVDDLSENFMDDGGPVCRNSFTPMQKVRMRFALSTERQSLLANQVCTTVFENVGFGEWYRPKRVTCDSLIRPQIELYNDGDVLVTSIDFSQEVEGQQPSTWTWTGSLNKGDTIILDLPAKFLAEGIYEWIVNIEGINGNGPDGLSADNVKSLRFVRLPGVPPQTDFPVCTDSEFGLTGFSEINWDRSLGFDVFPYSDCLGTTEKFVMRYNTSGAWEGGFGQGAGPSGTRDALISRPYDLTGFNQVEFSFVTAYKESFPDKALNMNVWVLPGCGEPLVKVYSRSAAELESSTTPFNPGLISWIPSGCSEWIAHSIDLGEFAGQTIRVMIELELEAEYSQNFYLDNFCIDASVVCPQPEFIPVRSGTFTADTACLSPEGWIHYWKYADTEPATPSDVLLFSMYSTDSVISMAPSEVSMIVGDQYGNGAYDLSEAPYVRNGEGWYVGNRYWNFSTSAELPDSSLVRVYFSSTDLSDLQKSAGGFPVGTPPLTFFRIGSEANPALGHPDVTSEGWSEFYMKPLGASASWTLREFDEYFAAELILEDFDGIGMGTSGDKKGIGPTYPSKMTIVNASQQLGKVIIDWEVPKEMFALDYQVWRKGALENQYDIIGIIPANGTIWEPQLFRYTDDSPQTGEASYFITQSHTLPLLGESDTASVVFDPAGLVNAYPNPTAGTLWFSVDTEISEPVYAGIYNANWQLLTESSWRNNPGEQSSVDLTFLPPGVYFYVVRFMRGAQLQEVRGKLLVVPEG